MMGRLAYPIENYKWMVRCYYTDKVKSPKIPGDLAIETVHTDDFSKDLEVRVSEKNEEYKVVVEINPRWRGW
jgi:hypothetical protein